jgi:hypothetical protein
MRKFIFIPFLTFFILSISTAIAAVSATFAGEPKKKKKTKGQNLVHIEMA